MAKHKNPVDGSLEDCLVDPPETPIPPPPIVYSCGIRDYIPDTDLLQILANNQYIVNESITLDGFIEIDGTLVVS